jgi:3-isopropylmalate dehydrogenase
MREALRVLEVISVRFSHAFDVDHALVGGAAIDACGDPLPNDTRELVSRADAVLLGAVGGPQWDDPSASVRPEQGLLALRKLLGTFANVRPVRLFDAARHASPLRPELLEGVNLVVVRELTGGLYFGEKSRTRREDGVEVASENCTYTSEEIERVVREAGHMARSRRGLVSSVDKANVMETSRLWRQVTTRVMREEFPDLRLEHVLVDACAMHLVRTPSRFDVIVTENLFGDILTDEASVLAGSIGLLPSASLGARSADGGPRRGLYEPIHGSAPDIAGQNKANPIGMILSVAMMLASSFGLASEARIIERAVNQALNSGAATPDLGGTHSTSQVADAVIAAIDDA